MQVQFMDEKEKKEWLQDRDYLMQIKTRINFCKILSLTLSAVILLGMLAVEWLPYKL
ncbi:hypothetical protein AGMMS49579_22890 [Spirochaetia bacterium]|nr:hypothetical protein AGMMS49579_22890 [Spirochaetia bacterium]